MKQLIVISGLPGAGKSTVAKAIAKRLQFAVVSIDPIEAAMWHSGLAKEATGIAAYDVAAAVCREQLQLETSVIADAVNPVEDARQMWRELADEMNARPVFIEVICSDRALHKQRIDARQRNIPNMPEVTWDYVEQRGAEYEPWKDKHLTLDSVNALPKMLDQAIAFIQSVPLKA